VEPILDPAIGELSKTLANFSIVEPGISSLDTNESVPNDEMYAEEKYIRMNTEMIYERAETLGDEKYVGTMQYFYFLVGQLMMSAYLQNVLSDIQTFYTEIVGLFDHARFYDLKVIKMVVVPLKRIFSELELDAEELDRILNKIVYAYIAKLFKDKPISEFPSAIEESKSLLNAVAQYFSEFDEMLEREIDKILVAHYDNNTGIKVMNFCDK
jgi:hypothetical protein